MKTYEVVNRRVKRTGITVSELARRADMQQGLLRKTLIGERVLKADEFVRLCRELELDLSDFAEVA